MRKRRRAQVDREEQAFRALVGKFSKIQYLLEHRALFDIVEKTPVGICITNKKYIYEYVNPAYCRIYGYDFDELIGKPFTVVVPEEHRPYLMELHDRFMHQEYELEGEWEVVTKDNRHLTILANAVYVVDEQNKPKKITFVLDRTEASEVKKSMDSLCRDVLTAADIAVQLKNSTDQIQREQLIDQLAERLANVKNTIAQRKKPLQDENRHE